MVIGASDTGKSTLARYLFRESCRRGRRTAYLDTDVGQSTLGLPTTVTVALSGPPGDDRFPPQGERAAFFVGATTPRGHMLPLVIGSFLLQQKATAFGAEVIVVDTTGLVDRQEGGKALKQWKIELLRPTLVIGLQRTGELDPILRPLRRDVRVGVAELPVSPYVTGRSREARIARRQEMLARYFGAAQPVLLSLRELALFDPERLAAGAVLALQDAEGLLRCLGVLEEVDRARATLVARTPQPCLDGVSSIRLGSTRWDLVNRHEI